MKKRFAIFSFLVLLLLVVSQVMLIRQVAERDKSRFREEVNASITDIVKYQVTKQTFHLFRADPQSPSITLERVHPDSVSINAKSYGSYESRQYKDNAVISVFLEDAMTEMLLESNTLNLHAIDSLFQGNFPHISELSTYTFKVQENERNIDSLYWGINTTQLLNNTTKGMFITLPLGTSDTYRFIAHFIFKPATAMRHMTKLAAIPGVAVVSVAVILYVLLVQLQRKKVRLEGQEKRVSGIVHDLKAPLTYIYSMLGLLELKEKSSFLTEGKTRVKHLSDSIERILSEVKLNEKKSAALQREAYDIEHHCHEMVKDLRVVYKEKEIIAALEIEREARIIQVDPFYFDSCLRNLLDNAVKYSGDTPYIIVTAKKEKNITVIAVIDKGSGIPKKEQHKVFSSFYRSSQKSPVKGHGIGLSTVRQIVKAHGGSITLNSEPGKGAVFTITLPDIS